MQHANYGISTDRHASSLIFIYKLYQKEETCIQRTCCANLLCFAMQNITTNLKGDDTIDVFIDSSHEHLKTYKKKMHNLHIDHPLYHNRGGAFEGVSMLMKARYIPLKPDSINSLRLASALLATLHQICDSCLHYDLICPESVS